ncbi:MAG: hypothetical protein KC964_31870 [Candidatus Omnitrophica bacterium]|nr:hypothetical protein [Candidatus Omnitrophota bacterium]
MPRLVNLLLIFSMFMIFLVFGLPVLQELQRSIVMDLQADWHPVPPGQKSFLLICLSIFAVVCFAKLLGNNTFKD